MQSSNVYSLIVFSRSMSCYRLDLFQYLITTIHYFCSSSIQKGKNVRAAKGNRAEFWSAHLGRL